MKAHFIISLPALILSGCTRVALPQTVTKECPALAAYRCAGSTTAPPAQMRSPVRFATKANAVAKEAKYRAAGKMDTVIQVRKAPAARPKIEATTGPNEDPLPTAKLNDKADPIVERAKATIAAMMENPGSAEFRHLRRAVRYVLGQPIDSICGYVMGKSASGDNTEKQFVYIVQLDEAYLIDGTADVIAPATYRYLCD